MPNPKSEDSKPVTRNEDKNAENQDKEIIANLRRRMEENIGRNYVEITPEESQALARSQARSGESSSTNLLDLIEQHNQSNSSSRRRSP